VSGNGISWAICKSAPRSRQITTPAPHHSVFYRPDALPVAQPTVSKYWRQRNRNKGQKQLANYYMVIKNNYYHYNFCITLIYWDDPPQYSSTCFKKPMETVKHGNWNGFFCVPDVLPATKPSVSKHWSEHKVLTLSVTWSYLFFIHHKIPNRIVILPLCWFPNASSSTLFFHSIKKGPLNGCV